MKTCKALICAAFLGLLLLSLTACGNSETPAGGVNKPEDIPEEDSALLVQTIEMSGSAVYITALSGRYEASGGFTSSGDQVFAFKLCKDEDDFNGYFWEPAVAGASSRRTYYGARSFWTDYYRAAVKLDAFHPVACTYEFNEDGELIELYQCADLSYRHPEPAPAPEPEPKPRPELDIASEYVEYTIVLSAEDADLTGARDVVLEPNTPPYNLGGWKADNTVTWEFDVDFEDMRDGVYDIYIEYSRAYTDAEVWGTAIVSADDDPRPYLYEFQAENTSSGEGDWSEYEMLKIGYGRIYSGATYKLEMYPGTRDAALSGEHFINLRSITFVPTDLNIVEQHAVTNTAAPVAFEGKWYSYTQDVMLIVEGNTFTHISKKYGNEQSGVCEMDGEALILYYSDVNYRLYFMPDGILFGDVLGHLRPQDGDEPGEAPIDLSANSYLGEWYCEELDESITLRWDYGVSHEGNGRYNNGDFEPYGNRLVLGYTANDGAEDTVFNGGDAVYDPDAQTLTTAGQYVYERVSYSGGGKTLPDNVREYDFYDWGSPYHSYEEIASAIIAVWQENGEKVDSKYLDVDGLIEAIADSDSEYETIFRVACELAGVDITTYLGYK